MTDNFFFLSHKDKYVFELERRVTAEAEQRRHESETRAQLREEQLRAIREEKIRKQKEAARKIAPGFLDTDRRILTPVNARRRPSQQGDTIVAGGTENELNGKNAHGRASSNDEVGKMRKKIFFRVGCLRFNERVARQINYPSQLLIIL
jgi:hypothetical protein